MAQLFGAVGGNDLERLQRLLESGADPDVIDDEGQTLLNYAIELDRASIVVVLVQHLRDDQGNVERHAFHEAAERGKTATVLAILDHFAVDIDSEAYDRSGKSTCALILALDGSEPSFPPSFRHPATAMALLDAGAYTDLTGHRGVTVLHIAACLVEGEGIKEQHLALIRKLIVKRAYTDMWMDLNCITFEDMQPLHCAIYFNFYEAAVLLIEAGAPLNLPELHNSRRLSPLFMTPKTRDVGMVKLLLDSGADVNAVDHVSRTFLHFFLALEDENWDEPVTARAAAARAGQEMLRLLLERGARMWRAEQEDEEDNGGLLAIHVACESGLHWAVNPLVEAGEDVNAASATGRTPLIVACGASRDAALPGLVKALLEAGADWALQNVDGRPTTALERLFHRYNKEEMYQNVKDPESIGAAIAALVVAGDRRVAFIPSPCCGLEAALYPLWDASVDDMGAAAALPAIFQRLEPEVQTRVRTALLALKRFWPAMPEALRRSIMKDVLA